MRTKLVYIMGEKDIEVLRKAKSIINSLYNEKVEFEEFVVEQDFFNELAYIEDMCIDKMTGEKFPELCDHFEDSEDDEDFEEEEDDEDFEEEEEDE